MAAVKSSMLNDPEDDDDLDDSDLDPDRTPLEDVVRIWYEPQEGGES